MFLSANVVSSTCLGMILSTFSRYEPLAKYQQRALYRLMWAIRLTRLLFCKVRWGHRTDRKTVLSWYRSCSHVNMSHRYPSSSPPENDIWIDGRSMWGLFVHIIGYRQV